MRRLFLLTLCLAAVLTKTVPGASQSRLGTIESIVERGTFQLDLSTFVNTVDKVQRDGHFYSHQPPLLSTLEAPVYWLLHGSGARFHNRGRFVMTWAFTLLTNGVALALTVLLFAHILSMVGVARPARDVLAIMLPLGTWLLPYALVTNNHGISGLLLTLLIWLLLSVEQHGATRARAFGVGVVLGLLAAIEILPIVSFVPAAMIYLWLRRDVDARARVLLAAGVTMPLLAHAILNIPITGDVVPAAFHSELFQFEGSGFDEASLTGSLKHVSAAAIAGYSWQSLFAGKGFFVFAPLCLLGLIAGLTEWRWWRSRAGHAYVVLLVGIIGSLSASLLMTNNFGGGSVGFRHAVYLSPVFAVLVLPWVGRGASVPQRRLVMITAVVSMGLMLIFGARAPWFPLTLSDAPVGSWDQYSEIIGRLAHGDLLIP